LVPRRIAKAASSLFFNRRAVATGQSGQDCPWEPKGSPA
jgi:hypothetical protein